MAAENQPRSHESGSHDSRDQTSRRRGSSRRSRDRNRKPDGTERSNEQKPRATTPRDEPNRENRTTKSKSDAPVFEARDKRSSLGHPTSRRAGDSQQTSTGTSRRQERRPRPVRPRRPRMNRWTWARVATFVALSALLVTVLWRTIHTTRASDTVAYSEFVSEYVRSGETESRVTAIRVMGERVEATLSEVDEKDRFERITVHLGSISVTPELIDSWIARGIEVEFRPSGNTWGIILATLPYIAIIIVVVFLFRQAQGAQRGIFSFGKSRATEFDEDVPSVTFDDVAGVEEAKQELQEVVDFLREPDRYQKLGGRIPRGVLMVGAPGTGKTYLARAVAGEAKVPFFSISGSDFVEMFVGVGASRVRDLFKRAKSKAPCIVFIDEIDAVGRQRGAGLGGGHDEREQTLNQLLVEMDGFNTNDTVILIAATNRPDVLDPALLRPGRFDRQVVVDMPDVRGRDGILRIHAAKVPTSSDVDFAALSRGTPGLSGADLKNLVNEAALLAARRDQPSVSMAEFEQAKEKVMWGMERRSLVMSDKDRRITAVHEAGHALAGLLVADADPVHKVSIVPRGRSLGLTAYLPDSERYTVSRTWCNGKLVSVLSGRAAEQIVLNEITNGAANDLETATELARRMVCDWGMSDRLGPVMLGRKDQEVFLGRDVVQTRHLSERTLEAIDEEVRKFVEAALEQARDILRTNRKALDALSEALLRHEVLDRPFIEEIVRDNTETVNPPGIATESDAPRPRIVERPALKRDRSRDDVAPAPTRRESPPPDESPKATEEPEKPVSAVDEAPKSTRRKRRDRRGPARAESPEADRQAEQVNEVEAPESSDDSIVVDRDDENEVAELSKPVETVEVTDVDSRDRDSAPTVPEVTTVPTPTGYGRTLKLVRRHGLRRSDTPDEGMAVSQIAAGVITYGRSPRPADDLKEIQWRTVHQNRPITVTAATSDEPKTEEARPESEAFEIESPREEPTQEITEVESVESETVASESDSSAAEEIQSEASDTEEKPTSDSSTEAESESEPDTPTDVTETAELVTEATSAESSEEPKPASRRRYGRRRTTVKRSALRAADTPEEGVSVSEVTSEDVTYGRSVRPADENPEATSESKNGEAPVSAEQERTES